jgi:hypothetical protein
VLYTSGYTDDEVVKRGVQRLEVAFLSKPYDPTALRDKVRTVLDRARARLGRVPERDRPNEDEDMGARDGS